MRLASDFRIPNDHPALEGHFPGHPVVPGVVILDKVADFIRARNPQLVLTGVVQAKFLKPLQPGELCAFTVDIDSKDQARFECVVAGNPIVKGILQFSAIGQDNE